MNSGNQQSPEPSDESPQYYTYPTAAAAERAANRYADRWPGDTMPSTPNIFLGGGMLWAYGEFSQAELEEMEQDPHR
jgi:hypothetical protein